MVQTRWDGRTCVLIRSRGRADPSARMSRALHSLTPLTHGSPLSSLPGAAAAGWRVGTCWLCWRRWYRYFGLAIWQGLPAQIHLWAVHDGSDGVPRRANLAEPVPWTQAGSWPLMSPCKLGVLLPSLCLAFLPQAVVCRVGAGIIGPMFRGPIRAFRARWARELSQCAV